VDTLLKKHPYAILASVAYFCFIFLAGIGRVLLLGIALPATLVLIHASLRLRGVKNKVGQNTFMSTRRVISREIFGFNRQTNLNRIN